VTCVWADRPELTHTTGGVLGVLQPFEQHSHTHRHMRIILKFIVRIKIWISAVHTWTFWTPNKSVRGISANCVQRTNRNWNWMEYLSGSISCPAYVWLAKVRTRRANLASYRNNITLNFKLRSSNLWLEANSKEFVHSTRTNIPRGSRDTGTENLTPKKHSPPPQSRVL
jgi:hypothetical protein